MIAGTPPPSPPTDRADDGAGVSSRDSSEDATTAVSDDTALSDGSSALTSPIPDSDITKETRAIQGPKNIQEVGIEAPSRGERILHDVAHTLGGGPEPSSLPRGYSPKLDLEDAVLEPQAESPESRPAPFAALNVKHAVAVGLSPALYFAKDERIQGLAFAVVVAALYAALCYVTTTLAATITPPYTPRQDLEAAHPFPKLHNSYAYCCITEGSSNRSVLSVMIGLGNHIPRWRSGECLTYVICNETFPTQRDAVHATNQLANAILMWRNVGVPFQQVPRDAAASFRVVYSRQRVAALASAFFPNDNLRDRTLRIYARAFDPEHVNNQANFLAHEIGHVLGLRHEFALEKEASWPSAVWGNRNPTSVMQYYPDSSLWRVQQQDLDELESLYKNPMIEYSQMTVRRFKARSAVYRAATKAKSCRC